MKKLLFMAAAASMMLAAQSCSEGPIDNKITPTLPMETIDAMAEQQVEPEELGPNTGKDSRTQLSGNQVIWTKGDQIHSLNAGDVTKHDVFTLASGENTTTGKFTGNALGANGRWAVYPNSAFKSATQNSLTIELPATQNYVNGSFGQGANPMVGKMEPEGKLDFKNLCGAFRIQLMGTGTVASIVVTTAGEKIAGQATVAMNYTSEPTLSVTGTNSVTLANINESLSEITPSSFYIVVPAGTYAAGMTFEIIDNLGNILKQTTKSPLTVNRTKVAPLKAFNFRTPTNFPDPAFRAAIQAAFPVQGQITTTDDGMDIDPKSLAVATSATVTLNNIDINKNIKSIQGIQHFTALTMFRLEGSALTTIDASSFPPLLMDIIVINGELTSVDLKGLASKQVRALYFYGNKLQSIDISMLTNIRFARNGTLVGQQKTGPMTLYLNSTQKTNYWDNINTPGQGWKDQAQNTDVTPIVK